MNSLMMIFVRSVLNEQNLLDQHIIGCGLLIQKLSDTSSSHEWMQKAKSHCRGFSSTNKRTIE